MPFLYSTRLFQRAEQFGTNIDLVGGKIATRVSRCRFPRGGVKWQTLSSGSLAIYGRNRLSACQVPPCMHRLPALHRRSGRQINARVRI